MSEELENPDFSQEQWREMKTQYNKAKDLLQKVADLHIKFESASVNLKSTQTEIEKISNEAREKFTTIENAKNDTRVYYRKSLKNQKALTRIEIEENLQIKKEEKKLIQEEVKVIDENIKKAKQEKRVRAEIPELIWDVEFKNFRASNLFKKFSQILDCIYQYGGKIKANPERGDLVTLTGYYSFEVDKDILIYADTNGLVNLVSGSIALTEKGRFFAQRYSQVRAS